MAAPGDELAALGVHHGEPVRFRKHDGGRWWQGRMHSVAADGSFTIYDLDGAARSLRPERLEVRRPGATRSADVAVAQRGGHHLGAARAVVRTIAPPLPRRRA